MKKKTIGQVVVVSLVAAMCFGAASRHLVAPEGLDGHLSLLVGGSRPRGPMMGAHRAAFRKQPTGLSSAVPAAE